MAVIETVGTKYLPNYNNGSIVNLMSSILNAYGSESQYQPLKVLKPDELRIPVNIVLMIVDGLGYDFLLRNGEQSVFKKYLKSDITSVFPATTATAITTFVTGVAPQQHAVTGWYVYLKELGLISTILPFRPRCGGPSFSKITGDPRIVLNQESVFEKIRADSYYVIYADLLHSDYTDAFSSNSQGVPYYNLTDFFRRIGEIISSSARKKYIYAYWPELDALCHDYGTKSTEVLSHFRELSDNLAAFIESINGTNTVLIITADHGLIDTNQSRTIKVMDHPEFIDTLTMSLCGEPRIAYCYVHPSKVQKFGSYVKNHFKDVCDLCRGEELIKDNYFGLFEPHAQLFNRIGDYVLIMKDNYVMRDFVMGEKQYYFIGNHGGVSREEMLVPLVVVKK